MIATSACVSSAGLSPEQVSFQSGMMTRTTGYNILRPEVVESIFMMHRITNDSIYRDMGWTIFQAFETYSKVRPIPPHLIPPVNTPTMLTHMRVLAVSGSSMYLADG